MTIDLARTWWTVALRDVLGILFGLSALVWPGITLLALVALFGAYALMDGIFAIVAAFGTGYPVARVASAGNTRLPSASCSSSSSCGPVAGVGGSRLGQHEPARRR